MAKEKRRRKGMGRVFKSQNKFYLQYTDADGKRKCTPLKNAKNEKVTNHADAEKAAQIYLERNKKLHEIETREDFLNEKAKLKKLRARLTITLDNAFDLHLTKPHVRPASENVLKVTRRYWQDFVYYLKDNYRLTALDEVEQAHAEAYIAHIRQNGRWKRTISYVKDQCPLRRKFKLIAIVATVITVLILPVIGGLHHSVYLYYQSRNWERVTCCITKSTAERVEQTWPEPAYYTPKIEFQYVYNEHGYTSQRFKFDCVETKYDRNGKLAARVFEEGELADCYVNPKNPSEAVLLRDGSLIPLAFMTLLPLLLWGAAGCVVLIRKKGIKHVAARVSIILLSVLFLIYLCSFIWTCFAETLKPQTIIKGITALLFAVYIFYRFVRFCFSIKPDGSEKETQPKLNSEQ